jgi:hypothetical protein
MQEREEEAAERAENERVRQAMANGDVPAGSTTQQAGGAKTETVETIRVQQRRPLPRRDMDMELPFSMKTTPVTSNLMWKQCASNELHLSDNSKNARHSASFPCQQEHFFSVGMYNLSTPRNGWTECSRLFNQRRSHQKRKKWKIKLCCLNWAHQWRLY